MILETREERALLLQAGFTLKQIEALYLVLNKFTVMRGEKEKEDEGKAGSPSSLEAAMKPVETRGALIPHQRHSAPQQACKQQG